MWLKMNPIDEIMLNTYQMAQRIENAIREAYAETVEEGYKFDMPITYVIETCDGGFIKRVQLQCSE